MALDRDRDLLGPSGQPTRCPHPARLLQRQPRYPEGGEATMKTKTHQVVQPVVRQLSLRLIVAGGCHVVGFPFSENNSFSCLLAARLREKYSSVELRTIAYVKMTEPGKVTEALRLDENREARTIIVLQLGNFEYTAYLTSLLPARLKGSVRLDSLEMAMADPLPAQSVYPERSESFAYFVAKSFLKIPLYLLNRQTGSADALHEANLRAFLQKLPNDALILLLPPLPSLDLATRFLRRRAGPTFVRAATGLYVTLVEPFSRSDYGVFGSVSKFYYDSIHLNTKGHFHIAQALERYIDDYCLKVEN